VNLVESRWGDVGLSTDPILGNTLFIARLGSRNDENAYGNATGHRAVAIEARVDSARRVFRVPPVVVNGTHTSDSEIGPNMAIGDRNPLRRCTIDSNLLPSDINLGTGTEGGVREVVEIRSEVTGAGFHCGGSLAMRSSSSLTRTEPKRSSAGNCALRNC